MFDTTYRAGLGAGEIIAVLSRLVERRCEVEHLLCRYLADLADRFEQRRRTGFGSFSEIDAYRDVYHAAHALFGLGVRRTRERVRIGFALRQLPAIERAFAAADVSYSQVRELTRIATPTDEEDWLAVARLLPMRLLERRVAAAIDGDGHRDRAADKANDPANLSWRSGDVVDVRFTLRAKAWDLLERAMEGARAATHGGPNAWLTDGEALEAVARDALAYQQRTGARDPIGSSGDPIGSSGDPIGSSGDPIGSSNERSPEQKSVLAALARRGAWHPDAIVDATGLSVGRVNAALFELELAGLVRWDLSGHYQLKQEALRPPN
jgi:hypothetical protein